MDRISPIFCYFPEGQCLRTLVASVIWLIIGVLQVKKMFQLGPLYLKSLGQCGLWLQHHYKCLSSVNKTQMSSGVDEWIPNITSGVHPVRVVRID